MEDHPNEEDLVHRREAAHNRLVEATAVLRAARTAGIEVAGEWKERGRRRAKALAGPGARASAQEGSRMKEGIFNGHSFKWETKGLTCENCGRGTRNQKYLAGHFKGGV